MKDDESPDKMLSGDICGWQGEAGRGEGKIREERRGGRKKKRRKRIR